jgi:biotin operon repressor
MEETLHYKGHRWTNEELVKLMKYWAADATLDAIATELSSTKTSILKQVQRMRKAGIPLKRRRKGHITDRVNTSWTQGEVEYLIRRRNDRATSEEIGSEIGRTPNAVDAMIQKLRKDNVQVAMRGNGVRRLWDSEALKALTMQESLS